MTSSIDFYNVVFDIDGKQASNGWIKTESLDKKAIQTCKKLWQKRFKKNQLAIDFSQPFDGCSVKYKQEGQNGLASFFINNNLVFSIALLAGENKTSNEEFVELFSNLIKSSGQFKTYAQDFAINISDAELPLCLIKMWPSFSTNQEDFVKIKTLSMAFSTIALQALKDQA